MKVHRDFIKVLQWATKYFTICKLVFSNLNLRLRSSRDEDCSSTWEVVYRLRGRRRGDTGDTCPRTRRVSIQSDPHNPPSYLSILKTLVGSLLLLILKHLFMSEKEWETLFNETLYEREQRVFRGRPTVESTTVDQTTVEVGRTEETEWCGNGMTTKGP